MRATRKDDIAVYTLRVRRDHLDRLHEIALDEHRSLAQLVRVMFEDKIAQADERKVA